MFKENHFSGSFSFTYFIFIVGIFGQQNGKRPFYNIAHMVNSIRQVRYYLDLGANSLESDIQFYPNGSVNSVYHGFPCDCFRTCHRSTNLDEYLQYVRSITDPDIPNSYHNAMVMQFFDLKMGSSNNKLESGRDIARHVLDHLWTSDQSRKQEVRALIYIESPENKDVISGFLEEFTRRGQQHRLKDVGFDGGSGSLYDIQNMFKVISDQKPSIRVWQGDGKTNCLSPFYPDGRLRRAVSLRDSKLSSISKVYHWTIDIKFRMRISLNLGIDGMITNDPDDLAEVLQEPFFEMDYRIATPDDDPFAPFGST